jgi:hypothetical protein
MMGSESHYSGRRHPEPTHSPSVQNIPSFAATFAELPSYRSCDAAPPRPGSRSSPPSVSTTFPSANPSAVAERSSFTPINHASPHVRYVTVPACGKRADLLSSPTNTKVATTPPEHHRHLQSSSQSTVAPFNPVLTCATTAPSQPPIGGPRQDSAISHHRFEGFKDPKSIAPSEFSFSYSHPATNNSRPPNDPRTILHPPGPSSPHSPPSEPRSNQASQHSAPYSLGRRPSGSVSSVIHHPADPARSPENSIDLAPRNIVSSPNQDSANTTASRQQRYNVRFNTVYTSENMPPSQKARQEPPPAAHVPVETSEPQSPPGEQTVTPSVEPVTTPIPQAAEEQSQHPPQQRSTDPPLQRCQGCGEAWRRPLPDLDRHASPAENMSEQFMLTQDLVTRLRSHTKKVEEAYSKWVWTHTRCPIPQETPLSPADTEILGDSYTTSTEDGTGTDVMTRKASAKRKSDIPPEDGQRDAKSRKVTFDTPSIAPPRTRPSAPA